MRKLYANGGVMVGHLSLFIEEDTESPHLKFVVVFQDPHYLIPIYTITKVMASTFDIQTARAHFPALKSDQVFFDNAGGSQILGEVATSCEILVFSQKRLSNISPESTSI
jgi:hypothetical protein